MKAISKVPSQNGQRKNNKVVFSIVIIFSVLLLMVGAELFAKAMSPKVYDWVRNHRTPGHLGVLTAYHSILGWSNDLGDGEIFRGDNITDVRTQRTMLVLGDSVTQGYCVETGETYVAHIDNELVQREVLNAGVVGYSTVQEYLLFKSIAEDPSFRGKLSHTVIQVHPNDFWDNTRSILDRRPFMAELDGRMTILNSPVAYEGPLNVHTLSKKSSIIGLGQLLGEVLRENRARTVMDKGPGELESEDWDVRLEATKEALFLSQQTADAHGIKLIVFLFPAQYTLFPNMSLEEWSEVSPAWVEEFHLPQALQPYSDSSAPITDQDALLLLKRLDPPVIDPFYDELVRFGEEEGVTILDMTKPLHSMYRDILLEEAGEAQTFYCDPGHPDAAGHRAVASVMLETMRSGGFLVE